MDATEVRPQLLQLAIERGVTNPPGRSHDHGENHWKSVAIIGSTLVKFTPGANREFVFTFALLHDLMRENEYDDPHHGARAAALFLQLVNDPGLEGFPPYADQTTAMFDALSLHVGTPNADGMDVNIGVCWDADRLNLWRVGKEPDPHYLTTEAARLEAVWVVGYELSRRLINDEPFPTWTEIREMLECQ